MWWSIIPNILAGYGLKRLSQTGVPGQIASTYLGQLGQESQEQQNQFGGYSPTNPYGALEDFYIAPNTFQRYMRQNVGQQQTFWDVLFEAYLDNL